jgi:hypothetical protein
MVRVRPIETGESKPGNRNRGIGSRRIGSIRRRSDRHSFISPLQPQDYRLFIFAFFVDELRLVVDESVKRLWERSEFTFAWGM